MSAADWNAADTHFNIVERRLDKTRHPEIACGLLAHLVTDALRIDAAWGAYADGKRRRGQGLTRYFRTERAAEARSFLRSSYCWLILQQFGIVSRT